MWRMSLAHLLRSGLSSGTLAQVIERTERAGREAGLIGRCER